MTKTPVEVVLAVLKNATDPAIVESLVEAGATYVGSLRTRPVGLPDQTMHGLALSMLPALRNPEARNAAFLDYLALAFHAHVLRTYGDTTERGRTHRAELSPWQLRRVDA